MNFDFDPWSWDYATILIILAYFSFWLWMDTYFMCRLMYIWFRTKLSWIRVSDLTVSSEMTGFNLCGGPSPRALGHQTTFVTRDCVLAQRKFWRETGWNEVLRMEGATIHLVGCNMPVFKAMSCIQKYTICTRILCWNCDSFFLEQIVASSRKMEKVFAICLARYRVDGPVPHDIVHELWTGDEISDKTRADLGQIHADSMGFPQPQEQYFVDRQEFICEPSVCSEDVQLLH